MEVNRTLSTSPLQEFDGNKRIWLKVDDISKELYYQHYKPTVYNIDYKILTTEQYIPPYQRMFMHEGNGEKL